MENFRYTWIHNRKIIKNENSHMLIIHNVNKADVGKYQCRIRNTFNDFNVSDAVVLNIRGMYVSCNLASYINY